MATNSKCTFTTRWGYLAATAGLSVALIAGVVQPSAGASTPAPPSGPVSLAALVGGHWGDQTADKKAKDGNGKNQASADPGSLYTIENAIGARSVWQEQDSAHNQITGQGVAVALLDSGTATVAGLDSDNLSYGPDLSIEANGVLTDQDTFGHGTHMAGIIAARDDAVLTSKSIPKLDPAVQLGVAPDSELVSLKLANTDGSTDVSQVIAGLNWVTEHPYAADGTRIRVINLSFGTSSVQPYQLDPLAAAAENAWRHGLVVVVAGGNEGQSAGRLTDPAIDPYVIAVGASSSGGTVQGWQQPTVAPFTNSGTSKRHVDLLAPGTSIVSLRDPGSTVDVNNPSGLVSGDTTGRLFRGSGTSQATAVVSGAAALLLQAVPTATPDLIKAALTSTATSVDAPATSAGSGQINVSAALKSLQSTSNRLAVAKVFDGGKGGFTASVLAGITQNFPVSTGQGSLNAARGDSALVDGDGNDLVGEVDVQGNPWDAAAWWAASSNLTSWQGGQWLGVVWTGDTWVAGQDATTSARWSSARWSSARWSDADWSSARWSSARWSSARWSSARWSSARWSDQVWG